MPAGLLRLASVSAKSLYFHNTPTVTFFKSQYKRHTNFTIETLPQYFNTTANFGDKVTCSVAKNGDLMSSTYIYIELPGIFSTEPVAWVNHLGYALIKTVTIEIGNQVIDSQTGEWLYMYHKMKKQCHCRGVHRMTGNLSNQIRFSTEKDPVQLYIPLAFWFCNNKNQSIPLCALEYSDVNIIVEFNTLDYCLKQHPTQTITVQEQYCLFNKYEVIEQTVGNSIAEGIFVAFENGRLQVKPTKGTFQTYRVTVHPSSVPFIIRGRTSSETCVPLQTTAPTTASINISIKSASLLIDYIHLDSMERDNFRKKQQMLITRVQTIPDVKITTHARTIMLNSFNNMTKELVWRCRGLNDITSKNYFNYNTQQYLKTVQLTLNGVVRMSARESNYYNLVPFHQRYNGHNVPGVYHYIFSLNPLEYQPSGHINLSKMDEIHLDLSTHTSVTATNPIYLKAYSTSYNYLLFENGMCKILFIN